MFFDVVLFSLLYVLNYIYALKDNSFLLPKVEYKG